MSGGTLNLTHSLTHSLVITSKICANKTSDLNSSQIKAIIKLFKE